MRRRLISLALLAALALPGASLSSAALAEEKKAKQPYLQLETLAASVNKGGGRHGVITVEVGIDAREAGLRDKLDLYVPLLRSAYVSVLQPYALGLPPGAPPNADYIAMALQRETDRVLGRKGARLLLGSILVN